MNSEKVKHIFDRYISIFIHGKHNISSLMSEQFIEELSLEQFSMIRLLYLHGPMRFSELADELLVHKSAITVRAEKLVNRGYIIRKRDREDRRNVYLLLSEEGNQLYESLNARIEQLVSDILQHLPEKELEGFLNTYEKIANYLEKYKEEK